MATAPKQPEKLTPAQQEAVDNARDAQTRKKEAKAPTTLTTMGQAFAKGGMVMPFEQGTGRAKSSASSRADGIAQRGKTRGKYL